METSSPFIVFDLIWWLDNLEKTSLGDPALTAVTYSLTNHLHSGFWLIDNFNLTLILFPFASVGYSMGRRRFLLTTTGFFKFSYHDFDDLPLFHIMILCQDQGDENSGFLTRCVHRYKFKVTLASGQPTDSCN